MRLSAHCLKRYKDIAVLLLKHRRPGIPSRFGLEEANRCPERKGRAGSAGRIEATVEDGDSEAAELPNDLERLGPTFIKLGQLLSSRADLLPERYLRGLARLQDNVKPFAFEKVEFTIENELRTSLGEVFLNFEAEPMAAASLGQVHRATLRDGRLVVVKVQRPGIAKQIEEDFEALEEIARFLERHTEFGQRYQVMRILEEFENTLAHELDYRREAANMVALARNLRDFERLRVPLPVQEFSTRKVLTMDYVPGIKITELPASVLRNLDGATPREGTRPTASLADELFHGYLKQILVDGIFHADPHPGNILVTEDGKIGLLDLGMVGHTTPSMREALLKLLLAVSEGESDEAATTAIAISNPSTQFDESGFRHRIGQLVVEQQNTTLEQMDVGGVVLAVGRSAADTGLFVPTELSLLGKTLLQLDEIGRTLDPEFDPNEAIRRHAREILNERIKSVFTKGKLFSTLIEAKELAGALPGRLNKILDAIGNAQLNVNVKPGETEFLVESARKVANRITTGVVLAALIIGAALLMRVPTTFEIFGYPGLAMICFLVAAGGGFFLLVNILWQDHKSKQKARGARFE
ncbi:MAG: ABC transporter [Verrucomicrobia bacterium]|nr:MAG: ABC transporter [Verrucomicrobiota bacterium]